MSIHTLYWGPWDVFMSSVLLVYSFFHVSFRYYIFVLNIRLSWSFQECHHRFKHFIWQLKCNINVNIKLSQWLKMSLHPKYYAYQRWSTLQFSIFLPYFRIEIYQRTCYFLLRLLDKFLRINTFGSTMIKKYAFCSSDNIFLCLNCPGFPIIPAVHR